MNASNKIELRIVGEADIISFLTKEMEKDTENYRVVQGDTEQDQTILGFGMTDAAVILAIVHRVVYLTTFAKALLESLKASKSNSIIVQTPLNKIEIKYVNDLTEDDIKKILKSVAELP